MKCAMCACEVYMCVLGWSECEVCVCMLYIRVACVCVEGVRCSVYVCCMYVLGI